MYASNEFLPTAVKNALSGEALDIWRQTYNKEFRGDDTAAAQAAWKAVEAAGYENVNGKWRRKLTAEITPDVRRIASYELTPFYGGGLYAVKVPRKKDVPLLAGEILAAKAKLKGKNYSMALREVMQENKLLAELYTGKAEVDYWLIGKGAEQFLKDSQ